VTNQRIFLAVSLGAVFLAIFVVTTVILLTLIVPEREAALVKARPQSEAPPQVRLAEPTNQQYPWTSAPPRGAFDGLDTGRFEQGYGGAIGPFGSSGSREPYPPADWRRDGPVGPGWQSERGWTLDEYRFRPLDERERERMKSQGGSPYDWPYSRDERFQDPVFSPQYRTPDGFTSDWGETPYRFRPVDPPRTDPDSRRTTPGRQSPRSLADPGLFQQTPQWGATPPELPPPLPYLYPSLGPQENHRLTTR
jgi:hypothetical protein